MIQIIKFKGCNLPIELLESMNTAITKLDKCQKCYWIKKDNFCPSELETTCECSIYGE